jgi:hypothetical protein
MTTEGYFGLLIPILEPELPFFLKSLRRVDQSLRAPTQLLSSLGSTFD